MNSETDKDHKKSCALATLDATDRKLLALLSEDARLTYAELGKRLHLSAPAVHERAKRLRQSGVVKATVVTMDPAKLGRPLLAFVHVDTTSWMVARQLLQLEEMPDIEEIHTVTGDSAMLLKGRELMSNVVFARGGLIRRQAVAEPVCCRSPVVRL
jgi:Lrp/AsnC family transcriptional regulator, leucine-responsive regulatory protein